LTDPSTRIVRLPACAVSDRRRRCCWGSANWVSGRPRARPRRHPRAGMGPCQSSQGAAREGDPGENRGLGVNTAGQQPAQGTDLFSEGRLIWLKSRHGTRQEGLQAAFASRLEKDPGPALQPDPGRFSITAEPGGKTPLTRVKASSMSRRKTQVWAPISTFYGGPSPNDSKPFDTVYGKRRKTAIQPAKSQRHSRR
jgi:hypothetical protein